MERLLHQYFRLLVRYNAWANRRLYDRFGALDEAAYRSARLPSGRTAHQLLNARLAADRLWFARLNGYAADERSLGDQLHESFEGLRDAQLAEDVELFEYVHGLAEEDLLRPTSYDGASGERHTNAQYELLTHLAAEQVGARAVSSRLLHPAPDLDMLTFFRDAEVGIRPLHP